MDACNINAIKYSTYQEAAPALGIFADNQEAPYCMSEAIANIKTPQQLRILFVHLLINECIPAPIRF